MEIYQIRAFVTVARVGNLTRAAQALNLTQPAVTAQIKALEQSLGVALFDRSAGKFALAKAGATLLPTAEAVLALGTQLKSEALKLQGELHGTVELGIPSEQVDFLRLGELASSVTRSLPLIELQTQVLPTTQLVEYVCTGRLSAALTIAAYPPRDVQWMPLRSITYRIVLPNAMAEHLKLGGWPELAMLPWLDGPHGSHIHLLLRELFERHGLTPRVVMNSADQANMDALVRAGAGCALVREEVALAGAQRQDFLVWGHARIDASLGFITSTENAAQPILVALISMLKEIWNIDNLMEKIVA
ncbi:LysR family transcriptional regulator [Pollutimonas bauzanensis]|uniref:DNA-binding transcriptional regulator, LysR family n=1 Tax=Pollutimonas bauzanensis TaxID=658167 RepID=A0A1M5YRR8_9BURK|nr:LysR family transcriptional regulator [Pollutimonas bauzanensis]SHI14548.1 DNA-binding transcriptional regulator, LysR family [Pollutimonas bauzanensis]